MKISPLIAVASAIAFCTLAHSIATAQPPSVAVEGCSVFDPDLEKMLDDQTIVIRGDRIAAVTQAYRGSGPA